MVALLSFYILSVITLPNISCLNQVDSCHFFATLGIYSVITDQGMYEAVLNYSFTVRCTVVADPPPSTITWKRKGSQYLIQYPDDPLFGILQKTATLEDDGAWICDASGQLGGLHRAFTVVVLGRYIIGLSLISADLW